MFVGGVGNHHKTYCFEAKTNDPQRNQNQTTQLIMETIATLTNIKSKEQLYQLFAYKSGWTIEELRAEINQIICKNRNMDMNVQPKVSLLRFNEVIIFLSKHGAPKGYKLSEEIEEKIKKLNQ